MKTTTLFLLFWVLCSVAAAAQATTVTTPPCTDASCLNEEYPYFFCNSNGEKLTKCSKDPNNEPGLHPYKKATPQGLCPDFSGLRTFDRIFVSYTDGSQKDVFNNLNMQDRLTEARDRWEYLCPPQGPNGEYQYCCVRVIWSQGLKDMGSSPQGFATTWTIPKPANPLGPAECEYDCVQSYIAMNQESSLINPDQNGIPREFVYTESANAGELPPDYHYASAYSVLLHELGHWYGFGHSDQNDANGNSCDHSGSIMHSGTRDEWWGKDRDLDPEDICMFKKLYCCEASKTAGVNDEEGDLLRKFSFEVVPNPARLTVRLVFADAIGRDARLRVLNTNGETMSDHAISIGRHELSFDVSNLPAGFYMFEVIRPGFVSSRKVMVAH